MSNDNSPKAQDKSFKDKVITFVHKHPVFVSFITIIVAGIILLWLLFGPILGLWTRHNSDITVPMVKNMSLPEAVNALRQDGFDVEVDSIYVDHVKPGTVVEQSPKEGSHVKPGRTVFLVYSCFSPKFIVVPNFQNVSRRQAISAFEEVGLTNITVKEVPSEYADLVMSAKYNGLPLKPGQKIPAAAAIVLEVGAGLSDVEAEDEAQYEELVLPEDADEQYIHDLQNLIGE